MYSGSSSNKKLFNLYSCTSVIYDSNNFGKIYIVKQVDGTDDNRHGRERPLTNRRDVPIHLSTSSNNATKEVEAYGKMWGK